MPQTILQFFLACADWIVKHPNAVPRPSPIITRGGLKANYNTYYGGTPFDGALRDRIRNQDGATYGSMSDNDLQSVIDTEFPIDLDVTAQIGGAGGSD